jgi:hypothetical protein
MRSPHSTVLFLESSVFEGKRVFLGHPATKHVWPFGWKPCEICTIILQKTVMCMIYVGSGVILIMQFQYE